MEFSTLMEHAKMGVLDWYRVDAGDLIRMIEAWDGDGRTFNGIAHRAMDMTGISQVVLLKDMGITVDTAGQRLYNRCHVRLSRLLRTSRPAREPAMQVLWTLALRLFCVACDSRTRDPEILIEDTPSASAAL